MSDDTQTASYKIADPLIELLAIKLYEHDTVGGRTAPVEARDCWRKTPEEDREMWRQMARGEIGLYDGYPGLHGGRAY